VQEFPTEILLIIIIIINGNFEYKFLDFTRSSCTKMQLLAL
jgi:hypothetical protein